MFFLPIEYRSERARPIVSSCFDRIFSTIIVLQTILGRVTSLQLVPRSPCRRIEVAAVWRPMEIPSRISLGVRACRESLRCNGTGKPCLCSAARRHGNSTREGSSVLSVKSAGGALHCARCNPLCVPNNGFLTHN